MQAKKNFWDNQLCTLYLNSNALSHETFEHILAHFSPIVKDWDQVVLTLDVIDFQKYESAKQ